MCIRYTSPYLHQLGWCLIRNRNCLPFSRTWVHHHFFSFFGLCGAFFLVEFVLFIFFLFCLVCYLIVFLLCLAYPILPMSLACPLSIDHSVFSNVLCFLCSGIVCTCSTCRRGYDRMVVGFTTTYAISAYLHWCCGFESRSERRVQRYVINFVSDLQQVSGFLWVLRFPPPIKLTAMI